MREFGIEEMMQALGRRYVYYINRTYRRTGTLWGNGVLHRLAY
jgi:putative transposase